MNYTGTKIRLHLIRLLARLKEVLTDESVENEFWSPIRLNTGFISRRVIRLWETSGINSGNDETPKMMK